MLSKLVSDHETHQLTILQQFPSYKGWKLSKIYKSFRRPIRCSLPIAIWPHLMSLSIAYSPPATKATLALLEHINRPWPQDLRSCCCLCLNSLSLDIPSAYFLASFCSLLKCHFLKKASLAIWNYSFFLYTHTFLIPISYCIFPLTFIYLICIYFSY